MKKMNRRSFTLTCIMVVALLTPHNALCAQSWKEWFFSNKKMVLFTTVAVGALAAGYWWFSGKSKRNYTLDQNLQPPSDRDRLSLSDMAKKNIFKLKDIEIIQDTSPQLKKSKESLWQYAYPKSDASKAFSTIPLITNAEWKKVTVKWGDTTTSYPVNSGDDRSDVIIFSKATGIFPAQLWSWQGTNHDNGIHPKEFENAVKIFKKDDLKKNTDIIISLGVDNFLRTNLIDRTTELRTYIESDDFTKNFPTVKAIYVLNTPEAIEVYNRLVQKGNAVLMFLHLTC